MLNVISGLFSEGAPPVSPTSYESIATVNVGGGGSSSITFSSIPSTFKHLQVRLIARSNRSGFTQDIMRIRYNGDTGANYAYHMLEGTGVGSGGTNAGSSTADPWIMFSPGATATASAFNGTVIDILDYTNTNKNTTTRALTGLEQNTSDSRVSLGSVLWNNTAAVTSIDIAPIYGTGFVQYTQFALYGIKG
jgi:hypothetical protein